MMPPSRCARCAVETKMMIMSMYNTDWICMDCKDKERARPDYTDAVIKDLMELADRMDDPRAAASIRRQAEKLKAGEDA